MNTSEIQKLTEQIKAGYKITETEAQQLASCSDKTALYKAADELRKHFCGNKMDLCSITNAKSGRCSENCKWCSQSAWHKTDVAIYPMVDKQQAVREAVSNNKKGVIRHSLVTSGRAVSNSELDELLEIYAGIKHETQIELCASMGLLNREQLQRLAQAGIKQYHCNLETAPSYFPQVCTTHSIEEKIQTIRWAQEIGLSVCSGGIMGMGETMSQRIELAFTLRELGILSIPINILNPIEGTELQGSTPLSEEDVLTTISLFRFINPQAYLRFAGGRLLIRSYQEKALRAGINASIVGDMLTTIGSNIEEDLRDFRKAGFEV